MSRRVALLLLHPSPRPAFRPWRPFQFTMSASVHSQQSLSNGGDKKEAVYRLPKKLIVCCDGMPCITQLAISWR